MVVCGVGGGGDFALCPGGGNGGGGTYVDADGDVDVYCCGVVGCWVRGDLLMLWSVVACAGCVRVGASLH